MGEGEGTFLDHRLDVVFRHAGTGREVVVPGHFAADGRAADSGASAGSVWRAHFNPPETGQWTWQASFRRGDEVAVASSPKAGASAGAMDGETGAFRVGASNKGGADLRGKGVIEHDGDGYLNHAGTGEVFLKSGVGSPENFLAYSGFDNTPGTHDYAPHARHFEAGDPSWDGGKGRGILGAVNYLADQGVNSAYMLLMNVGGDGRDVWPWAAGDLDDIRKNAGTGRGSLDLEGPARAFDVSKLEQWDRVFSHMQEKGIALHLFLQETENDFLLNDGDMGVERALYMREMVSRFGHHNGVIWNLGEENTNTAGQLRAHSKALKALDPYDHPVALHTYPNQHKKYEAFEGSKTLDVLSFQTNDSDVVPNLERYLGGAEKAGRPVAAFLDEPGHGRIGIKAKGDPGWQQNHEEMRDTLWRFFMDGGSGVEWYFGYDTANGKGGDLAMEDFRLREGVYWWTEAAREFFEDLPLERMSDGDKLTSGTKGADEVLADPGETYAIYLPKGGTATLDLRGHSGRFDVDWYDPHTGATRDGSVKSVDGGDKVSLGQAPGGKGREWAVLVDKTGGAPSKGDGSSKGDGPNKGGGSGKAPAPITKASLDGANSGKDNDLGRGFDGKGPGVHKMKNGLVVMQAEDGDFLRNGAAGNKTWDFETKLKGYKGDGYLIFDSKKDFFSARDAGSPATGPMEYTFRIDGDKKDVSGTYYISLRTMKPQTGEPHDRNNDFYVAAGEADDAPSGWKKLFFGGSPNKWNWGHTYDVSHKKSPATFEVDGPGEYSIFVSGRSRQAGLDEIHVQKGSRNLDGKAPTSDIVGDKPAPSKPSKPDPKPKPQPVDKGDDGKDDGPKGGGKDDGGKGGGKGGPTKAVNDNLSFDAGDITIKGKKGFIEIDVKQLLANDSGHDGSLSIHRGAVDGSVQMTDGGRTVLYAFDVRGTDGSDAFGYRIDGKGKDFARAYFDFDLEDGGSGGGSGGGAPSKPAPSKPAPKPADAAGPEDDFVLVDARTDKALAEFGDRLVVDADSAKGMAFNIAAEAPTGAARSAVIALDGKSPRVETEAPYALYGDVNGDFNGGLTLSKGDAHKVTASFKAAGGKSAGKTSAEISVQDDVLKGKSGLSDVFVFHHDKMGRDTITNFEGRDALAFFGGISAKAVLNAADVKGRDTVIDLGGGDVLTLKNFTGLGLDDFIV